MAEVNAIVGGPGHRDRSVMRYQQHLDFAFIVAYWFLFLLVGVLLGRRRFPLAKALAFFSVACATLAAILDVRENLAILKVLKASPAPGNDALAQAVRASAVPKWALLFVAMALLSFAFLGRKDWRSRSSLILMLPGLLFLLTSAVGLLSLLTRESMLELTQVPMLIGLVALLLALWGAKSRLVEGI
jgi:hypothetical protein